jgi:macrodomain Ter protein organizer (MatP/YcbG family)
MTLRSNRYADKEKLRITRNAQRKRYYNKTSTHTRKKWTDNEIELLFNNDLNDHELSDLLKRSVQSIQLKRCRVNKELNEIEQAV